VTVNAAPAQTYTVTLNAAPATVIVGGTSTLTATVTPNNGAPTPTSFAWDCDGNGTTDATTATNTKVCTYPAVGSFTAKVTATGGTVTGSATTGVTVNLPTLTASLAASATTVPVGATITFTATVVGLASGETIIAYQWDLDATAGYEATTTVNTRTSAAFSVSGLFTAKLLVTTSTARTVMATTTYVVTDP
jgi:PKD repeat protein